MKTQSAIGSLGAFALALSVASSAFATDIYYHHLDIDVDYVSSNLALDIKTYGGMSSGVPNNNDDYPASNRINIPTAASNQATMPNPNNGAWACVAPAGVTVYRILENESSSTKNWLGINSEDLAPSVSLVHFVGDTITLSWRIVSKPHASATLAVYSKDFSGNPTAFYFNNNAGSCAKNSITLNTDPGAHFHADWAASHTGVYEVEFRATGTVVGGGGAKDSGWVKYTFFL